MNPLDVLAPVGLAAGLGSFVATMAAGRRGPHVTPARPGAAEPQDGAAPESVAFEPAEASSESAPHPTSSRRRHHSI